MISLPNENTTDLKWIGNENDYTTPIWKRHLISNVSKSSIEIFKPNDTINTGTSVIIAPGGGMYALSIESEGIQVAEWLTNKGITAIILKYRIVPTQGDAVIQMQKEGQQITTEKAKKVLPLAINDGLNAIDYIRKNSEILNLNPDKIGFMGFSAGGAVLMGVTQKANKVTMPNFIVPVYAWTTIFDNIIAPKNTPKMLVICATDDEHGFVKDSINLYNIWLKAENKPAMQLFSKGGHGFGMDVQNLPSDKWIERFYDWAIAEYFIKIK